jgi:hypothetical protein
MRIIVDFARRGKHAIELKGARRLNSKRVEIARSLAARAAAQLSKAASTISAE